MIILCFYENGHLATNESVAIKQECYSAYVVQVIIGVLPYWFRFAQCLRKFHETEQRVHLVNAGKYFACIAAQLSNVGLIEALRQAHHIKYQENIYLWMYLALNLIKATYCYAWDIIMDWGLLRQNQPGPNRFLRDKINYSPAFYYWAMASDFVLRYLFLVNLFFFGAEDSMFNRLSGMTSLMIFAEAFRRAQWALLRVENEQNNNLEAYRTIPIIPPIVNSQSKAELLSR